MQHLTRPFTVTCFRWWHPLPAGPDSPPHSLAGALAMTLFGTVRSQRRRSSHRPASAIRLFTLTQAVCQTGRLARVRYGSTHYYPQPTAWHRLPEGVCRLALPHGGSGMGKPVNHPLIIYVTYGVWAIGLPPLCSSEWQFC